MADSGRSPGAYHWQGETLFLSLQVQPRASQDQWVGGHGDAFKLRLTAPPVDGKANAQLIKYLARLFGVPKSRVSLLSGENERRKRVSIASPRHLPAEIPPQ